MNEIKRAREIGYKSLGDKYIWIACLDCKKERWVAYRKGKPQYLRCPSCSQKQKNVRGNKNPNWKKGEYQCNGYIRILLQPKDFFYSMVDKDGYVPEHRLIMAKHLNRCLHLWETVHHKNGVKDDNRIENLELLSEIGHSQLTRLEQRIKYLENQIREIKAQKGGDVK